jgi:succinoglycan biosynthesis transport protein ExoP
MTASPQQLAAGPATAADDEIDLRQLAAALQRHWRLIAKVAGGTLLLSGLYAFLTPKVWEGEFQIVLASNEPPASGAQQLLQSNPGLAQLIGNKGGENELETEVKILESPSVLKPVFDFVKEQKISAGESVDKWRYSAWLKDNLTIELEKGTSVLNLSYRDTDKALVLPALQRISREYQAYSGRDRERGISQAIKYLDQQIVVYKRQSVDSLRKAQQFAIEQDLTALKGNGEADTEVRDALNIEAIRIQAANEIRSIDEQLKQLRTLSNDPEAVMFRGLVIPELATQGIYQSLDDMDVQLALLESKFTAREDSIRQLKEKRRLLINVLRKQTFGYLEAKRTDAQARIASTERPKGVLIKYRELLREAGRDEATLTKLEAERQLLALEQARKTDPWELISTPTLLDAPVAPRKSRILALGLLAGLVAGSGAALVVDRRSGRVFADEELQQLLPAPLLAQLNPADSDGVNGSLTLLARGALAGSHHVALIPVGLSATSAAVEGVLSALKAQLPHTTISCSLDLVAAKDADHQLLITSRGSATRQELSSLRQQLELQARPVTGWLLLESSEGDAS